MQPRPAALRRFEGVLRAWPIRWRILLVTLVNMAVILVLALLVWFGARILSEAWADLSRIRQSDWALVSLESEAGRLQSLLQRYFTRPEPSVLNEIARRREALATGFASRAAADPALAGAAGALSGIVDRSLSSFEQLRAAQSASVGTYETEVLKPAREMAGLYAIIDGATRDRGNLIWPSLGKSREAFTAILVAINAYYLSPTPGTVEDAKRNIAVIARTIPVMRDLADTDLQRDALKGIDDRAAMLGVGLDRLADNFATQGRLLRELVDSNGVAMSGAIDTLSAELHERETAEHARYDQRLGAVYQRIGLVALVALAVVGGLGIAIARTISGPLSELMKAMDAIVAGDYRRDVSGLDAGDEIGAMARTLEVFRADAIARHRAETESRQAKERAESALSELRDAQESLVEAEKLAALGSLVAGVAHEVNNPIGISLTVASSLSRRGDAFVAEIESGPLRRSRLIEFVTGARDAAQQLVANLQRAAELVQAFKQVAVDRSHAERRTFDLREATEQIMASLRPGLKTRRVRLDLALQEGILLESYPGPFGQVLTNLFVNAVTHAFADDANGTLRLEAHRIEADQVEIVFSDDGHGMTEEVQRRAFDPFFTTMRGRGGTGLGLNIVYNIVTRQLGGRIKLVSSVGRGTTFRITLPLVARGDDLVEPLRLDEILDVPHG